MRSFMLQSDKFDEKGNVALNKARFVIDGREQEKFGYDLETYAPNMTKESFRFLLCIVVQFKLAMRLSDVCQAFLLPTLNSNEYYFIIPPAGFELLCAERGIPFKKGQVLQLLAAVYGLKNASNYWNTELTAWLTGPAGLTQCVNDPCLFIRKQPFLAVGIHT